MTPELLETEIDATESSKYRTMLNEVSSMCHQYPESRFEGRGIVICGGGWRLFPCIWVNVRMLRRVGCRLPIELWHLGPEELSPSMRTLLAPYDVTFVDALPIRQIYPVRTLKAWELKAYSLLHCRFREVLLLDADNVAVVDPGYLFEDDNYKHTGAVFWPDYWRFKETHPIWEICGLQGRDTRQFESGQILVDKCRCWQPLSVAMHLNEYSDFYYRYIHGDKDTFHIAWLKCERAFSMPPREIHPLPYTMCQHDFRGRRIFQHRNLDKWIRSGRNERVKDFWFEADCRALLAELRDKWTEMPTGVRRYRESTLKTHDQNAARLLTSQAWRYHRVGHDVRLLSFDNDGFVADGAAGCEVYWNVSCDETSTLLEVFDNHARTFWATLTPNGRWRGRWDRFEKMRIVLTPHQS